MYRNRHCSFGRQKCDQETKREDSKIRKPYNRNAGHVECKNKCDTSNNRSNRNRIKIIRKVPELQTGKARNHTGTTANSHTGHGTHLLRKVLM